MEVRVISTRGVKSRSNGIAVSRDGSTLLVSDEDGGSHAIREFRVADGSPRRVIGKKGLFGGRGAGDGPLQFKEPRQVWIASDDFVFIADYGNNRVQVLTPRLDFHAFVGVGQLTRPSGVCANDAVVVVSEPSAHSISVFSRGDGAVLRRFGSEGRVSLLGSAREDGVLEWPCGLCFTSDGRHIAVADKSANCVSVFSLDGKFVRLVGAGKLKAPEGVACSASDELVVADYDNGRVVVFSASGELLKTMGRGDFRGVAVHGGTVFAQDCTLASGKCILFK